MEEKKRMKRRTPCFLAAAGLLVSVIVALALSLLAGMSGADQEYQFIASLGGIEYNADFLEAAGKIKGLRRITPVLELPARLRIEDYTMDTIIQAVDIEALDKKVQSARETPVGDNPVLLLGRESLGEMRDSNDHVISEAQQKKFLKAYAELEAEVCIVSENTPESGAEQWKKCTVAGILEKPAGGIYLPIDQGRALAAEAGAAKIEKVLLTVKGKENYEKAQDIFS